MSNDINFIHNLIDIPPFGNNTSDNISLFNNNFSKLQEGINIFNSEIEWDGMWTLDTAKDRLKNNWKLLVLTIDDTIYGWYWIDTNNKETYNLFVSKKYQNQGYGFNLSVCMLNLAKEMGIDKLQCKVNDWNLISIRLQERLGWVQV
jgi:RimJ/RimL family protein N-acetyltransferase